MILCLLWFENSPHSQNDPPVPSSTMFASGKKFVESMNTLWSFDVLSQRLSKVFGLLDRRAADQYKTLRKVAMENLAYLRGFNALDACLWPGRVLLFNRQTPCHRDSRNPPGEWTPLHAGGDFTEGGALFVHELNLRLRYLPGDLIFLRGHDLSHSVESWSGGQRLSAAYFSHQALWKYFKLSFSL